MGHKHFYLGFFFQIKEKQHNSVLDILMIPLIKYYESASSQILTSYPFHQKVLFCFVLCFILAFFCWIQCTVGRFTRYLTPQDSTCGEIGIGPWAYSVHLLLPSMKIIHNKCILRSAFQHPERWFLIDPVLQGLGDPTLNKGDLSISACSEKSWESSILLLSKHFKVQHSASHPYCIKLRHFQVCM